jgi:hypothetical protein
MYIFLFTFHILSSNIIISGNQTAEQSIR